MMLIFSLILFLLSCAINLKKDRSILYSRIFILVLLNSFFIGYTIFYIGFLSKGIGIFGGLFNITVVNSIFNLLVLILSCVIGLLTSFFPRKILDDRMGTLRNIMLYRFVNEKENFLATKNEKYEIIEYTLIILFVIIGGVFLMASNDTISIFLSIELQSYGLYILSSIYRNSESSTSAGLTYFLLGALASCFILLSSGILYANSGCTNLENLYIIANISEILKESSLDSSVSITYWYSSYYLHFSLIMLSIGFLFKVSAAPFHFWSPDVYDAVPTIVTTFIAIIPKITIFVFLLDLVSHTSISLYVYNYNWTTILMVSSLLSLIIGTVLGLTQSRIKRLYAYSTISHIGFILLALGINSKESIDAFLFYLIQYSISNLNAFFILICMGYYLHCYIYRSTSTYFEDKKRTDSFSKELSNSPIQLIDQIKGFFYINPTLSISLAITLFSFTGVPPLIGFFGKFMVLSSSIDNGYVFMAIIAILTSVIGGVYYLAIIKQMFFERESQVLNFSFHGLFTRVFLAKTSYIFGKKIKKSTEIYLNINDSYVSNSSTTIIALLTSVILLFIFVPSEILNLTNIISIIIFNS